MKNIKKRILTLAGVACLSMAFLCTPAGLLTAQAATPSDETVDPAADVIGYRYKEENGKLYRRLYNYTTDSWIGDWEYYGEA